MEEIEIWKDIEGYEGLYQVSNWGRIKSLERTIIYSDGREKILPEKILKPQPNNDGYLRVQLHSNNKIKNFRVHKLVALAFIPNDNPTEKNEINHLDENKENNHVSNLCWCSHIENINYGTRNERFRKSMKGRILSEEHKQKLSITNKGKGSKPILQYTLDGVFIRDWDSATSASKELKIYSSNITKCCKGKLKTCGGFLWRYM